LNQKLSDWATIAEVIGSFAVVVTLIVLIIQVRENTDVVQATNRQSAAERSESRTMAVAMNPEFAELLVRSYEPGAIAVGSSEEMRLFYFYASQMTSIEESYLLYREGLLEEEYVTGRARGALSPLDSPSGHRYLQVNGEGGRFSKDFMDWIYAIIDAGEAIQLPDSADR